MENERKTDASLDNDRRIKEMKLLRRVASDIDFDVLETRRLTKQIVSNIETLSNDALISPRIGKSLDEASKIVGNLWFCIRALHEHMRGEPNNED